MASLFADLHSATQDLLETYNDLNPASVDELYEEPSPLEFMRYVAKNRPFVVRRSGRRFGRVSGAAVDGGPEVGQARAGGDISDWPALKLWNASYLKEKMGSQEVEVAVTPFGCVLFFTCSPP